MSAPGTWPDSAMSHLWSALKTKADTSRPKAFPITRRTYLALIGWKAAGGNDEFDVIDDLKVVLLPAVDARTAPGLLGEDDDPTNELLALTVQSGLELAFGCERRPRGYVFARYGVRSFGAQVGGGPPQPPQLEYVASAAVRSDVNYAIFRQTFAPNGMSTTIVS